MQNARCESSPKMTHDIGPRLLTAMMSVTSSAVPNAIRVAEVHPRGICPVGCSPFAPRDLPSMGDSYSVQTAKS